MIFTIKLDLKTQELFKNKDYHIVHSQAEPNFLISELENASFYPPLLVVLALNHGDDISIFETNVWKKSNPYFVIVFKDAKLINLNLEDKLKKQSRFLGMLASKEFEDIPFLVKELQWQGVLQIYALLEGNQKLRDSYIHKFQEVEKDVGHMIKNLEGQLYQTRAVKNKAESKRRIVQGPVTFEYRYGVGYESGSEYAEFIIKGSDVWWINFSTNSYSSSSIFLRFLDKLKKMIAQDDQKNLDILEATQLLLLDLKNTQERMDRSLENHFFFAQVRPAKNFVRIASMGLYQLIMSNPVDDIEAEKKKEGTIEVFTFPLKQIHHMILVSPGYFDNILNQSKRNFVIDFVKENLSKFKQDILDEMMLFLDKRGGQDFYNYDTSLVYLEIKPHGIQTT